jgi:flavodoxin
MNALIVYDSVFGNTEKVARAIGEALGANGQVDTLPVSQVTVDKMHGLHLLIVGSPHAQLSPHPGSLAILEGPSEQSSRRNSGSDLRYQNLAEYD